MDHNLLLIVIQVSQFNLENVTVFNKDLESTTLKKETAENGYSGEKMEVDSKPEEEESPATFQRFCDILFRIKTCKRHISFALIDA